jgi:polyribonucleotide nucleotidyltransferase
MRLEIPIGERSIVLETGKLAKQAGGAVTARLGDTMVLSTATRSEAPRPGATFLPLSVDIEERMSSAGKIPGGFIKREGRPSERAILTSRLTDRPLRPLFPKDYHYEIQVIGTVLVADQEIPYDTVSMVGASAALALSDIPFDGPIGAVRVGRDPDGGFILNPTYHKLAESDLELVVAGTRDAITMVEAGANEVTEDVMVEALGVAQEAIRTQAEAIEEWSAEYGKEKQQVEAGEENTFIGELRSKYLDRVKDGIVSTDRRARHEALDELSEELTEGREEIEVPQILAAISVLEEADRSAGSRRDTANHRRSTGSAAGARHRAFHQGRDPGAQFSGAGGHGAGAEARHPGTADHQAIHAPLQLPALLDRRDRASRFAAAA